MKSRKTMKKVIAYMLIGCMSIMLLEGLAVFTQPETAYADSSDEGDNPGEVIDAPWEEDTTQENGDVEEPSSEEESGDVEEPSSDVEEPSSDVEESSEDVEEPTGETVDYANLDYTAVTDYEGYEIATIEDFPISWARKDREAIFFELGIADGTNPIWPPFSAMKVNGVDVTDGNHTQGAWMKVYPEELQNDAYNMVEAVSAVTDATFHIIIKAGNPTSSEIPTVEQPTDESGEIITKPIQIPSKPEGLEANINDLETNYTIAFASVTGATSYNLYINGVLYGPILNGGVLDFVEAGLEAGKTYKFQVTAVNEAGESELSTPITKTIPGSAEESSTANVENPTSSVENPTSAENEKTTAQIETTKPGEQNTSAAPIVVKKVTIKTATKKKSAKKLVIKIKKETGVKGYQIAVYKNKKSANKNKKAIVTKIVKKNVKQFVVSNKKLRASKKLYIKVRAYKMNKSRKIYGSWSTAKKVTIK